MRHFAVQGIGALALTLVSACAEEQEPGGVGLTIKVAPVEYPQIDDVIYDLGVYTRVGTDYQLVWHQEDVSSVTYGNAIGDITYIGPCDAQAQEDGWTAACADDPTSAECGCSDPSDCDAAGEKTGWVVIDIDSISADDAIVPVSEWQNPCGDFDFGADTDPTTAACVLAYLCEENADVLVEFNLTIMRDADQGFFDIIVEFEDVFCSAKFDTCYEDIAATPEDESGWIKLLFRDTDADGEPDTRGHTGVLAIACTGGPGADTNLYLDDVVISCFGGTTIVLDPSQDEGGNVAAPEGQDVVFGYATYFGREDLDCGSEEGESALQVTVCGDVTCAPGQICDGSGQACTTCTPDGDLCDSANGYTCQASGGSFACVREGESAPISCKKKYWNLAIGFATDDNESIGHACSVVASATASDGAFGGDWVTPPKTRYPVIRINVPISNLNGELICGNWGLDETTGSFVYTEYTSLACTADETSEFSSGGDDDCDFCHRMNSDPPHPIESTRTECGNEIVLF